MRTRKSVKLAVAAGPVLALAGFSPRAGAQLRLLLRA
jgi:hypothetical protein